VISHLPRAICSCACSVCLAIFEMADIHEQHINIKFCFKLGKTFTEIHGMMINVYGDQCISHTRCYEWFKRFKDDWHSTCVEPRLGQPSMSCDDTHVAQVCEIVHSNCRLTVQEIAEECNISIGSCDKIRNSSGSFKVCPTTSETRSERKSHCHLSETSGSY
jgi:hypothetical protein